MNYYYGRAITSPGGDIKIRVKPKNIQGDEVMELEMPLPHQVGFTGRYNVGKPIMQNKWTTLVSGRPNQGPVIIGSQVWLNIDGEEKVFLFNQSNR